MTKITTTTTTKLRVRESKLTVKEAYQVARALDDIEGEANYLSRRGETSRSYNREATEWLLSYGSWEGDAE